MHPACQSEEEFKKDVHFETSRGTGPGGQHRNRTDTAVRATHRPTGIRTQAGERRSLKLNRERALVRLRQKVALEHREDLLDRLQDPSRPFQPSPLWRSRLQRRRVVVSPRHCDFPALLAEALDVLHACGDDLPRAARLLTTSTAQMVRFLQIEPAALAAINQRRQQRGQKTYR
jgi:hypothetical protein